MKTSMRAASANRDRLARIAASELGGVSIGQPKTARAPKSTGVRS